MMTPKLLGTKKKKKIISIMARKAISGKEKRYSRYKLKAAVEVSVDLKKTLAALFSDTKYIVILVI